MSSLPITRACPECQALDSVELVESSLRCKQESCSFHVNFCCPVCDFPLESLELKKDIGTIIHVQGVDKRSI